MNIAVNGRLLYSSHMEGIARYTYETTYAMAISHPEDTFYIIHDRKPDASISWPQNVIPIVVGPEARHPILWRLWLDVSLRYIMGKYKIGVLYSPDGYLSLSTSIPTVLVLHDLAYVHYPEHIPIVPLADYRFFVPRYLKKAHDIVTVSYYVKKDIIDHFKIAPSKVSVAYNAYNPPTQEDIDWSPPCAQPYFLYVGSIHPRKNIYNLIQAFNKFNAQHGEQYRLVLGGRYGWKTQPIKQAIESSPCVIYLGSVTEGEKNKLIAHAHAYTYVSVHEGFGIPILEGFGQGTLVVTSNVTSMPEVGGDAVITVDPDDIDSIAIGLQQTVMPQPQRDAMIAKGRQRLSDFSWQKSAETIYSLLSKHRK
jgi:glycosyltransferase involved in cell wall biosynthesis